MPEPYNPLQCERILLSGESSKNFLSAVLGRIVGGWSGYKSWDLQLALLAAPVAHADNTQDNVYFHGLEKDGIDVDGIGRPALLQAAHDDAIGAYCDGMENTIN